MIPHEKALVERLKDKPFALVGINSDLHDEAFRKRLKDLGITWRSAMEGSTNGPIATRWNVKGWPTIYVLDAKGVVRYRDVRDKAMDEAVDALLKEMEK
jgi:thioredoxin family protein